MPEACIIVKTKTKKKAEEEKKLITSEEPTPDNDTNFLLSYIAYYMRDINSNIDIIKKFIEQQTPDGEIYGIDDGISLTAGETYVDFVKGMITKPDNTKTIIATYHKPLFSISLKNEGADGVNVQFNYDNNFLKSGRDLSSGESLEYDTGRASIRNMKCIVATGQTCTLQVSGLI